MNTLKVPEKGAFSQNQEPKIRGLALIAIRIFKFFASLKLAVMVLFTLMAVLATGTIIESLNGTEAARALVYRTPWFSVLLFILALNLAAAALDRLPWKIKHVGFVITHAGIITILFGSFLTQRLMIDGQITLAEGETEHHITLPDPLLYIYTGKEDRTWYVDLKNRAFPWTGQELITRANDGEEMPVQIKLLADYPKAAMHESVSPAASGEPAVKIKLHNSFVDQEQWLIKNHAQLGEVQMGPATLKFAGDLLQEPKGKKKKIAPVEETPFLEFEFEKQTVKVPVKPSLKLPATLPLDGTPYKIKLLRILKNAVVSGKELLEEPNASAGAGKNPAAELMLLGPSIEEKHTVFTNFPDFPTMHGMKPSAANVKIHYRQPSGDQASANGMPGMRERHEVRFVQKDGKLFCQIIQGEKVSTREVKKDDEIATGWMGGLTVKVEEVFPQAAIEHTFTPESNMSENPEDLPAIQMEFNAGSEIKKLWLRQGVREEFEVSGQPFMLLYSQKRIPAPFKLQLKDFRLETYPGTDRPASFESDVILKDDSHGVVKEATISMNKPLVYRGYRIYQSGYSKNQGEAEISVFSVGKDPGVPVNYLGAIVMVAGILTMFYTRRFSTGGKAL